MDDLLNVEQAAKEIFKCSIHKFNTEVKLSPGFPCAIGDPAKRGKQHWLREELVLWRNKNWRRSP